MSEWPPPDGPYTGPPETSRPLELPYAPYGLQPGYQPAGYPGYPPGYSMAGYPVAYPGFVADPRDARPGATMASAVLAFINAGLLILAGGLLLLGASIVSDIESATSSHTNYGVEFALDGTANFVAGALLITGGVMITGRKPTGRVLLTAGNGIVAALTVYWLLRFGGAALAGLLIYAVLFAALAAVSVVLTWLTPVTAWLTPRG